jgi:hypothetical protein
MRRAEQSKAPLGYRLATSAQGHSRHCRHTCVSGSPEERTVARCRVYEYTPIGGGVGWRAHGGVVLLREPPRSLVPALLVAVGHADHTASLLRRLRLGSAWVVGHGGSIALQ